MEKDFVITKAGWHTQRIRNYEFDNELVYRYFKALFSFLNDNKLTVRKLSTTNINDESELLRSDLNDDGLELMKKGYGRWLDNIFDRGKAPEDVKYLEKKLKEIRAKKGV
jgi:hypothetical protein